MLIEVTSTKYKKDNLILGVSKDKDDIEFKKWIIESLNKNIQILTSIEVEVITLSIKSYSFLYSIC